MRWHVHGTDAITGSDVELALDGEEATQAVQVAIDKGILVSHVTHAAGDGLRRILLPVLSALVVALGGVAAALLIQNGGVREKLAKAVVEQARLGQSLAEVEAVAARIREAAPVPLDEANSKVRQLAEQLASLRVQLSDVQVQLQSSREQVNALQKNARLVPGLESQLASASDASHAAEANVARLTQELALQRRRLVELENHTAPVENPLAPRIKSLETENRDLASQLDELKTQLLTAAAKASVPATAPVAEDEPTATAPAVVKHWALRTPYDAAAQFLALRFDKETFGTTPTADDSVVTTAARPANAAALRIFHDRAREKVYAGTLTASLAADGPNEKLAENLALAAEFAKTFAPSLQNPERALATAVGQLAGKDSTQRVVLHGADYVLTIWNDREGMYTFRVEPPRGDADE